jgi:hypothetical protein
MTFEELEADWEVWRETDSRAVLRELFARNRHLDEANFRKGRGFCLVNGCIMLPFSYTEDTL